MFDYKKTNEKGPALFSRVENDKQLLESGEKQRGQFLVKNKPRSLSENNPAELA